MPAPENRLCRETAWRVRAGGALAARGCAQPCADGGRVARSSAGCVARVEAGDRDREDRRCAADAASKGDRPLSGVRVLDLTRVLAGPTCARTLAEHGADVLHIASPKLATLPLFEMDTGHGKRQAYLDLDDPVQADTLRDLVRALTCFPRGSSTVAGTARLRRARSQHYGRVYLRLGERVRP